MKALVTGGAGFIGSHTAERLINDGNEVVIFDNFSTGKEKNINFINRYENNSKKIRIIRGDIKDYDSCLSACSEAEVVFHMAALTSVKKSMINPHDYNETNIGGTLNLLNACRELNIKKFIYASSSAVYGNANKVPFREEAAPMIISPYALTKLAGEHYLGIFRENYGMKCIALRFFNIFGPGQNLDSDSVVIPKFINCMLNDENPPVNGTGKQLRDFTYIDDAVEAVILAANSESASDFIFNIGSNKGCSVIELVDILNNILGKSIEPAFTPERPGDINVSIADVNRAQSQLGYKTCCDLKDGLMKTITWYLKNKAENSGYGFIDWWPEGV